MPEVTIDFTKEIGAIKPMHAVNNGPIKAKSDQTRGNFDAYSAANIPYARNHDASFCSSYGGEHAVDISAVFPDFDSDPENPDSYDFVLTDEYLKRTLDAGTKIFYRLGSKIEHWSKKYGTLPPKDFQKWAVICEHIIKHYNEGWADGFHWDIDYWEIWNEPDLDPDDSDNKRTWGGTAAEFYTFYAVAARHLKSRFPHLKIGGPALAGKTGKWLDGFLASLTENGGRVPLDFFSWHIYTTDPKRIIEMANVIREKLNRAGYETTESILNEWNYVEGWTDQFIHSIEMIISMRGAAFTQASMCLGQNSTIDMMMYYDARPCAFNGLFDFYTYRPLKGYYPFFIFSKLSKMGTQVQADSDLGELYTVAARGKDGTCAAVICYYPQDGNAENQAVTVRTSGGKGGFDTFLLDDGHDFEKTGITELNGNEAVFHLKPNSILFLTQ